MKASEGPRWKVYKYMLQKATMPGISFGCKTYLIYNICK